MDIIASQIIGSSAICSAAFFRLITKQISKLRITGLLRWKSTCDRWFPSQHGIWWVGLFQIMKQACFNSVQIRDKEIQQHVSNPGSPFEEAGSLHQFLPRCRYHTADSTYHIVGSNMAISANQLGHCLTSVKAFAPRSRPWLRRDRACYLNTMVNTGPLLTKRQNALS